MVRVFRETGSGAKGERAERRKIMALAQAREIDCVLVTELSRCSFMPLPNTPVLAINQVRPGK